MMMPCVFVAVRVVRAPNRARDQEERSRRIAHRALKAKVDCERSTEGFSERSHRVLVLERRCKMAGRAAPPLPKVSAYDVEKKVHESAPSCSPLRLADDFTSGSAPWRALGEWAMSYDSTAERIDAAVELQRWCDEMSLDCAIQARSDSERMPQLALFDLDSTLVQNETIDELAAVAGADAQLEVSRITRRAMNGELDFAESLERRVALLSGLDAAAAFVAVKRRTMYSPGAAGLLDALHASGCATAIVSGGFTFLAEHVARKLGVKRVFSNVLEIDSQSGTLTGRLCGAPGRMVDADRKREVLEELMSGLYVRRADVLAVGDGANDVPMLCTAGIGVAFNAKPTVRRSAPISLEQTNLLTTLLLFGHRGEQAALEQLGRTV